MTVNSPMELLALELSHIRDAEQQASESLRKIAGEAEGKELGQMLNRRLQQGERILKDVEQAMQKLNGQNGSAQNAAARGIIQENERMLRNVKAPEMKQAVAIAGVQKLEHYCIAAWGTVKALAREAGEEQIARAMERAVEEGYQYDRELTELAEGRINPEALQAGSGEKSSSSGGGSGEDSSDLKAREYRGEDGQIHHHTREYMERKGE